jgi:hypothetical protein
LSYAFYAARPDAPHGQMRRPSSVRVGAQ